MSRRNQRPQAQTTPTPEPEETETVDSSTDIAVDEAADEMEIQLLGATYGAESNAIRTVPREKGESLIARNLAIAVPAGATEVTGVLVESDTAGTGPAVNAETGEVTQPGEPLPAIAQDGGTPLEPDAGDDASRDGNA